MNRGANISTSVDIFKAGWELKKISMSYVGHRTSVTTEVILITVCNIAKYLYSQNVGSVVQGICDGVARGITNLTDYIQLCLKITMETAPAWTTVLPCNWFPAIPGARHQGISGKTSFEIWRCVYFILGAHEDRGNQRI